ncbi:MAG TPA: hypothetical protein PKK48_01915 [Phycisphaerae bacterium]|nr:hypothetical protein [Phycisphaerae bacterium]HPS53603.1 hypothetical protein [Phycisphaerae bacterium]
MTHRAKEKIGTIGTLVAAAILGAAAWEAVSGLVRPAIAQPAGSTMDDPRNATMFRLESMNQYKILNSEVRRIREILESGKLKVVADVPQLEQDADDSKRKSR